MLKRSAVAAVVVLALAGLSGCGGDTAKEAAEQRSTDPTSTPTATPTATPTPLSPFEDDPAVKVVREWAVAVAKDINAKDRTIAGQRPFLTAAAAKVFPVTVTEEIDLGVHYPGPLPLTPIEVNGPASRRAVTVCILTRGWGVDPKTNAPADGRTVLPARFSIVDVGGLWKIDGLESADRIDCTKVTVKGVPSR